MSNKKTVEKFVLQSIPNVLQSIRDIPHGVTVWISPEELERPRESVYATLNRVKCERPGEYEFQWNEVEKCFEVSRT